MENDIISDAFDNVDPVSDRFIKKNLEIVEKVRTTLEQKKCTRLDLANKMNISNVELDGLLCGMYNFSLRDIIKMEIILNINLI